MAVYGIVRWVDDEHEVAELVLPVHPTRDAAEAGAERLRVRLDDDSVRVIVLGD